jgi:hypothetical protein
VSSRPSQRASDSFAGPLRDTRSLFQIEALSPSAGVEVHLWKDRSRPHPAGEGPSLNRGGQLGTLPELLSADRRRHLGFCSRHDGPTFAPVENADFVGSDEQVFLLAYRAECHELFQKQASHRSQDTVRQLLDRGKGETLQRMIQYEQYWQGQGVAKGLEDARRRKARLDRQLLDRHFGRFRRLFLTSSGPMSIVSTASVTPNRTLSGTSLQTLHDPAAQIESLYVAFVQANTQHAVMLAWREEDKSPAAWVDEFINMPLDRMAGALVQWLFAYVENTYFSQTWWETLNDDQRSTIGALAQEGNPYYNHPKYVDNLPVPWAVNGISTRWMQPG